MLKTVPINLKNKLRALWKMDFNVKTVPLLNIVQTKPNQTKTVDSE